jgi:hypothetical protein
MSISFAPIQKCWPILSVRKFTDDEIMTALWFRQTYNWIHSKYYKLTIQYKVIDSTISNNLFISRIL